MESSQEVIQNCHDFEYILTRFCHLIIILKYSNLIPKLTNFCSKLWSIWIISLFYLVKNNSIVSCLIVGYFFHIGLEKLFDPLLFINNQFNFFQVFKIKIVKHLIVLTYVLLDCVELIVKEFRVASLRSLCIGKNNRSVWCELAIPEGI